MTAATKKWFEVDREGLAKILERRGKEFVIYELVSNAWDTEAKRVEVSLAAVPGQPYAELKVTDDHPEGWKNLEHAYVLFADSEKKGDPEKRGRFNLGEKLVLALCEEAVITTTTGSVHFTKDGRRRSKEATGSGSRFEARIRMTREELEDVSKAATRLLPPAGVETVFNGTAIPRRVPKGTIEATLPTEAADAEGILRRTARKTVVELVEPLPGEKAAVYELGVPVVEIPGDKYIYNVRQKVPLNSDRDNVTPAYIQELRTLALNAAYRDLRPEEAADIAVRAAMADEKASKEAVEHVMTLRFGEKRVSFDLSDPEANRIAAADGWMVIPPHAMSGAEWANAKKYQTVKPAGQVTPSPKPYSPTGELMEEIPFERWSEAMGRVAAYSIALAAPLIEKQIKVRIVNKASWPYKATYGKAELLLNLGCLGRAWFEEIGEHTDELLLHEFAHEYGDHLSKEYRDGLCRLAAKLATLCLKKPQLMKGCGRVF